MIMRCKKQVAITALSLAVVSGITIFGARLSGPDMVAAQQQPAQQIKDKTAKTLMRFAFSLMPEVYTGPDGKKISIDKKDPKSVMIPVDDARRIIRVAVRSARAQNCDLKVMQTLNHNAMVKYEQVFKKWTTTQKLFINQLHLFTVLYMTGNVKINEQKEGEKAPVSDKKKPDLENKYQCSDKERKSIADSIDAYLEKTKNDIAGELKRRGSLGDKQKKNEEVKKAQNEK